ncbi:hypothetical protein FEM54_08495 [Pseudomonas edaphica]|uniref:Uncharacterized protein n=1 Tax=Pseudomonas edaphica TaxID=2006980 RepID=A0ABY2U7L8_9PSED|nr:hypothetical protein FEM54_08495 [Pseudomonas edaphica]
MKRICRALNPRFKPFSCWCISRPYYFYEEKIVPTLRVGTHPVTLRVTTLKADAERPGQHSHAERGNDRMSVTHVSTDR